MGEQGDIRRMSTDYYTTSLPITTTNTMKSSNEYSRSTPGKEAFPICLSPEKSVTSLYEGLLSPDASCDEDYSKLSIKTKRLPYKKSSKNVSEHVGWLKSVYSSPRAAPP